MDASEWDCWEQAAREAIHSALALAKYKEHQTTYIIGLIECESLYNYFQFMCVITIKNINQRTTI